MEEVVPLPTAASTAGLRGLRGQLSAEKNSGFGGAGGQTEPLHYLPVDLGSDLTSLS